MTQAVYPRRVASLNCPLFRGRKQRDESKWLLDVDGTFCLLNRAPYTQWVSAQVWRLREELSKRLRLPVQYRVNSMDGPSIDLFVVVPTEVKDELIRQEYKNRTRALA